MQKWYLLVALACFSLTSRAQTYFDYDQAGNRIKRYYNPVPDVVPVLTIQPNVVQGAKLMTAVLKVYEINDVPTNGLIKVLVAKNPSKVVFTFNATATSLGGQAVQNASWTFDSSSNPNYYILTTSTVIGAQGLLGFGLTGTSIPIDVASDVSFSAAIVTGGGELNPGNNNTATKVRFQQ
ncbi:hypothetical protein GCM10028773_01300 [Spirosoma koreense]